MQDQQTHLPLFQAYKAHLEKIKSFLTQQKEDFEKIIKTSNLENKDSDYEKIVQNANKKIIEEIDVAIQELSNSIAKLEQEKKRKIQLARDTRPSKQKNI